MGKAQSRKALNRLRTAAGSKGGGAGRGAEKSRPITFRGARAARVFACVGTGEAGRQEHHGRALCVTVWAIRCKRARDALVRAEGSAERVSNIFWEGTVVRINIRVCQWQASGCRHPGAHRPTAPAGGLWKMIKIRYFPGLRCSTEREPSHPSHDKH